MGRGGHSEKHTSQPTTGIPTTARPLRAPAAETWRRVVTAWPASNTTDPAPPPEAAQGTEGTERLSMALLPLHSLCTARSVRVLRPSRSTSRHSHRLPLGILSPETMRRDLRRSPEGAHGCPRVPTGHAEHMQSTDCRYLSGEAACLAVTYG